MDNNVKGKFIRLLKKQTPTLLCGFGIAGIFVSTYFGIRSGKKAEKILSEKEDISFKDEMKCTWKYYILPAASALTSSVLIIISKKMDAQKIAALAGGLAASSKLLKEYQDKIEEIYGKDALNDLKKDISNTHKKEFKEEGNDLFYLTYEQRWFKGDLKKVLMGLERVNRKFINRGYASLSEIYKEISQEKYTDIFSDVIGWDIGDLYKNYGFFFTGEENSDGTLSPLFEIIEAQTLDPETSDEKYYIIDYCFPPDSLDG